MQYDLLIRGGEVVDPAAGYAGRLDVAIKRDRIAAVAADIPPESADQVVDAADRYVVPGLIDLHTHVYWGVTYWGIRADPLAGRSGVTTWVDGGSSGAYSLPGFREFVVRPSQARIYAFMNISTIGLVHDTYELNNLAYLDVDLFHRLWRANPDLVLGVKVRMDGETTGPNGLEPLRRARAAAERCGLPIMVHIASGPPELAEVLELLRPGDVLTHCFTGHGMRIVDEQGRLHDFVKRAWDAGLVLDIGHGVGSFSFRTAEALLAAGRPPDVISTDIHQLSVIGPMYDLPTTMSKFLHLGMSLPDVVRATTSRPAEVLGLQGELGTLKPGARADVALLTLEPGSFPLYDVFQQRRDATQLLRATLTILNGRPLPRLAHDPLMPWIELSPMQREILERGHAPVELPPAWPSAES